MSDPTDAQKKQISVYPFIRATAVKDSVETVKDVNVLNIDEIFIADGETLTTITKIVDNTPAGQGPDGYKETPKEICDRIHAMNFIRALMLIKHIQTLGTRD